MADFETPGVAVAVLDESGFDEYIYGYADVENKKKVTEKTLFNVASISKLVTAHAVMQLVDEGKVELDKPIENYLKSWRFPKSSFDSKQVTIRSVLNHSAGLSGEFGPGFTEEDTLLPLTEILSGKSPKRQGLRIVHKPGECHMYSNLGFGLLQLLVKDVTKMPFEEYAKKNVFDKLNMTDSSFSDPLKLNEKNDLAIPYNWRNLRQGQERFVVVAAAGLLSNLQDMKRLLLEETVNRQLLGKSSQEILHDTATASQYGLGHIISKVKGEVAFIGHTGLGMGWNSSFQFIPGSTDGIIILTNGDNGSYIHSTLTCYWYYSETSKRIESCKTASEKKLNGIGHFIEVAFEKGSIDKAQFDKFQTALSESRKTLGDDKIDEFIKQLTALRASLKTSIKDKFILSNLDQAFETCFYWIEMPWFMV